MKEIPLTQGQVAKVDDADYEQLSKYKWYASYAPNAHSYYARRMCYDDGKSRIIHMHRVILGALPGQQCDHINHDTLDNQRSNLRCCTSAQNQRNRKRTTGRNRYKGISWRARYCKWIAKIAVHSKSIWLGTYNSDVEAALAYDVAARLYHGKYACLNFPS